MPILLSFCNMFLVGLTGGISTGKSTVSRMLSDLGCTIIDADLVAREVVEPGTPGWKKIRETFGREVLQEDGQLNRDVLGQIVFSDADKRRALNAITHPEIYKAMLWKILSLFTRGHSFVILDLPLLFESAKMVPYMSYTIVVSCSSDQQLQRLMTRNSFTEEEALKRIKAQMSLDEKCRKATFVIDNSGDVESTRNQVSVIYKKLCNSRAHWKLRVALLSLATTLAVIGLYISS